MSPRRMISLRYPLAARSMSSADSVSLRLSKTPTTTQAVLCFSGLPLFMVNSIRHLDKFCLKWLKFELSAENTRKVKISMLFRRALLRELTATAVAVFLVVLAIGISRQLVRMLDLAAGGSVPSDSVFAL